MKQLVFFIILWFSLIGCTNTDKPAITHGSQSTKINCSASGCEGVYEGLEFIKGEDIAHQFSNKMSELVGEKLKKLYHSKNYVKVDFSNIVMITDGMGKGEVAFKLSIPFIKVEDSCDAYTSFDHVGGWNHKPRLKQRKLELKNALLKGHELDISDLKTTKEGLQEYWIQWKNKKHQFNCQ